ncbi:MAG TPA: DUF6597 domain-containing transcriptional factor [Thermoanaerobaculia bacterium]|nr:DUF6597 domain-containing transcriptional factor [Thermoanaerobaculia bacterium]
MTIHEIAPSPELAEYVDAYWWSDASSSGTLCILPDGCADVVFDPKGAFVVGAMTRPLRIDAGESVGAFGIRFRPGRAAIALGAPLTLLTDARAPLRDVTKRFPTIDHRSMEKVEAALRSLLADAKSDPSARIRASRRRVAQDLRARHALPSRHRDRAGWAGGMGGPRR